MRRSEIRTYRKSSPALNQCPFTVAAGEQCESQRYATFCVGAVKRNRLPCCYLSCTLDLGQSDVYEKCRLIEAEL